MKDEQYLPELLEKHAAGTCTNEELAMLDAWYLELPIHNEKVNKKNVAAAKYTVWNKLPIHENCAEEFKKDKKAGGNYHWLGIAAAITAIMLYVLWQRPERLNTQIAAKKTGATIVPGGKKATLTLADGSQIKLDDLKPGTVGNKAGNNITKTAEGKLAYSRAQENAGWNTLAVPAGGYYELVLSDGTKVWLNAKSTLLYPAKFTGEERQVKVKGEAYFEVAHDLRHPFTVTTDRQRVQVLGTHFNINDYADEGEATTTLLEGSIELYAGSRATLLKPQQSATISVNNIRIGVAGGEQAIAWVKNDFFFKDEKLEAILKKISRWYDVDYTCPEELRTLEFSGAISRTKSITQVLGILEATGLIKLQLAGRRITVSR